MYFWLMWMKDNSLDHSGTLTNVNYYKRFLFWTALTPADGLHICFIKHAGAVWPFQEVQVHMEVQVIHLGGGERFSLFPERRAFGAPVGTVVQDWCFYKPSLSKGPGGSSFLSNCAVLGCGVCTSSVSRGLSVKEGLFSLVFFEVD